MPKIYFPTILAYLGTLWLYFILSLQVQQSNKLNDASRV